MGTKRLIRHEKPDSIDFNKSLKALIGSLNAEGKRTVIENIGIGKMATTAEIRKEVRQLIEYHVIIYDGKDSLFFKSSVIQIYLKQD